jgi:hypothetical protein
MALTAAQLMSSPTWPAPYSTRMWSAVFILQETIPRLRARGILEPDVLAGGQRPGRGLGVDECLVFGVDGVDRGYRGTGDEGLGGDAELIVGDERHCGP